VKPLKRNGDKPTNKQMDEMQRRARKRRTKKERGNGCNEVIHPLSETAPLLLTIISCNNNWNFAPVAN